jgi:alkylation response protein AidB-like acyl-CoA dehydrogenase
MVDRTDSLRAEVAQFVGVHRPSGLGSYSAHPAHDGEPSAAERAWTATLRAGRWLCLSWPQSLGGRGLSPLECAVVNEAFALAGAPRTVLGIGERLVAPTLLAHGTIEQQRRFLPAILSGDDWWCQGFSEPEAGSDLASLRTRGQVRGDELVIDGQKVWTSEAHRADWIFLLCRTDSALQRHHGLSLVAVPVHQPGVEVRPLRQAHGGSGFNEVFLDGARAQLSHVIGGLGRGWSVATATLATERGGDVSVQHLGYEREFHDLVRLARTNGATDSPMLRQRLAKAWTGVQLLRFNGQRQLAGMARDEPVGPAGSLHKVLASEHHRDFGDLALDIIGAGATLTPEGRCYSVSEWQRIFFESRSRCISRGTNEIQRNVIAERVLGLPREPPA